MASIFMRTQMTIKIISMFVILCLFPLIAAADQRETTFTNKRSEMVESQIRARGISDQRVLNAMLKVKRHLFVPLEVRSLAYEDHALPIGEEQTISQPFIVALMTELLTLKARDKVLEIGTGSGYQAAILAELAREVYTIEISELLARRSEKLLKELGYKNIKVKMGDGFLGWPEYSPFDAIIVTCAPDKIPQPLLKQLSEGGRLVIPVGAYWQELKLVRKIKDELEEQSIAPVRFVPMLRK